MAEDTCLVATLGDWCTAWRFVTEVSAARLFGVDVDLNALLADYDKDDVVRVLLRFVWAVLDSLGPARAAEVLQRWGVVIICAEGVTGGSRG